MQMKRPLTIALCVVALGGASALATDEMSVQVKKTQVRNRESYLGKTLYELHYGDRVLVLKKGAAWLKVRPVDMSLVKLAAGAARDEKSLTGYLNKSALTTKRVVLKADQNAQLATSSEDVALAGKGFNDEVERSYQAKHPNLAAAFAALDQIEMNPTYSPSTEDVSAFRAAGGLGGGDL